MSFFSPIRGEVYPQQASQRVALGFDYVTITGGGAEKRVSDSFGITEYEIVMQSRDSNTVDLDAPGLPVCFSSFSPSVNACRKSLEEVKRTPKEDRKNKLQQHLTNYSVAGVAIDSFVPTNALAQDMIAVAVGGSTALIQNYGSDKMTHAGQLLVAVEQDFDDGGFLVIPGHRGFVGVPVNSLIDAGDPESDIIGVMKKIFPDATEEEPSKYATLYIMTRTFAKVLTGAQTGYYQQVKLL